MKISSEDFIFRKQFLVSVYVFLFLSGWTKSYSQNHMSMSVSLQNHDLFANFSMFHKVKTTPWTLQIGTGIGSSRLFQKAYFGQYFFRTYYSILSVKKMKVTPWLLVQAERMTLKSVNKQSFFFLEALGGLQISYGQVNSIYLNAGLGLGGLYIDSQRKSNYSAYLLEIGIAHEL